MKWGLRLLKGRASWAAGALWKLSREAFNRLAPVGYNAVISPKHEGLEAAALGAGGTWPQPGFGVVVIVRLTKGRRERAGPGQARRRTPSPRAA